MTKMGKKKCVPTEKYLLKSGSTHMPRLVRINICNDIFQRNKEKIKYLFSDSQLSLYKLLLLLVVKQPGHFQCLKGTKGHSYENFTYQTQANTNMPKSTYSPRLALSGWPPLCVDAMQVHLQVFCSPFAERDEESSSSWLGLEQMSTWLCTYFAMKTVTK